MARSSLSENPRTRMRTKSIRTNFQCLEGCRQTKLGNSDVRKWINGVGSWFYQQNKYIWSCWILSKWNTQVYDILEIYCWAVKKLLLSPSIDDTDSGIICSVSSPKVSVTFKLFLLLSLLLLLARFLGGGKCRFPHGALLFLFIRLSSKLRVNEARSKLSVRAVTATKVVWKRCECVTVCAFCFPVFFLCFLCSRVKLCFCLLLVNVVSWLSCECAKRNDYEFYFLSVFHQLYAMFICFVFLLLPSNNNNKEFYIWKSQSLTKTTHVDSTTHNNGHLYMRYTHANKQRYEIGRSAQKEEVEMCGYFISKQCRKNQ